MSQTPPRQPVLFVVAGAVLAVILWFILGPLSLVVDLVLGVWLASFSLGGPIGENPLDAVARVWDYLRDVHTNAFQDPTGVGPTPSNPRPTVLAAVSKHQHARVVAASTVAPIVAGLLAASAAGLTHSSEEAVCAALTDYVHTNQKSQSTSSLLNGTGSDDEWFASAQKLADTAADAGSMNDGQVATAGVQLQTMLKGDGGTLVTVSPGAVANVIAPIDYTCYQE